MGKVCREFVLSAAESEACEGRLRRAAGGGRFGGCNSVGVAFLWLGSAWNLSMSISWVVVNGGRVMMGDGIRDSRQFNRSNATPMQLTK